MKTERPAPRKPCARGGGAQAAAPPGDVRGGEDKAGGSRQDLAAAARGAHCETFPVCNVLRDFSLKSLGTVWAVGWARDHRVLQSEEPVPGQRQGWGR